MKTWLAFLVLVSVAEAQNLTSNIPYADPAHERQVLDIYAPDGASETTHNKLNSDLGLPDDPATKELCKFLERLMGSKR